MANEKLTDEQIADLIKRNADLEAENQVAAEIIEDQAAKLRAAEAQGAGSAPVVTHAGKNYRVLVPQFQYKDRVVKAVSLKDDAELVAQLVKDESGLLELIEEAESK